MVPGRTGRSYSRSYIMCVCYHVCYSLRRRAVTGHEGPCVCVFMYSLFPTFMKSSGRLSSVVPGWTGGPYTRHEDGIIPTVDLHQQRLHHHEGLKRAPVKVPLVPPASGPTRGGSHLDVLCDARCPSPRFASADRTD